MDEQSEKGAGSQVFQGDVRALRLPKSVEANPRAKAHLNVLMDRAGPLWPRGEIRVPAVAFSPALAEVLRGAYRSGRLVRGLEGAERRLAAEDRGLGRVDRRSGVLRGARVSRLLLLADDGAERFYRQVERLLDRQGPRVLALRLNVKAATLGQVLFGPGGRALLLLLDHKEAVGAALLALVEGANGFQAQPETAGG